MGRDDAPELPVDDPRLAACVWHRMRWANCWTSARRWPDGESVKLADEYARLGELDLEPWERIGVLTQWLKERIDPETVEREIAAVVRTAQLYGAEPVPVRRLRVVAPEGDSSP
jgi:hypothetical protein